MMDLRVVGNGDKGIACAIRIRWCGRNLVVEFEREESTAQCRAFLSAVMSRKRKYFAPGTHPGHRSSASTSIVLRPEETRFTPAALHAQTNYHIHRRRGTTPTLETIEVDDMGEKYVGVAFDWSLLEENFVSNIGRLGVAFQATFQLEAVTLEATVLGLEAKLGDLNII